MQKEISIDFEEGEGLEKWELHGKLIMKRLNFSEKNMLEEEATDIKMFGNTPQVKVSMAKVKEIGLQKSIISWAITKIWYQQDKVTKGLFPVEEPYALTMSNIQSLPQDIGEQLFEEFTNLNQVSEKKKER